MACEGFCNKNQNESGWDKSKIYRQESQECYRHSVLMVLPGFFLTDAIPAMGAAVPKFLQLNGRPLLVCFPSLATLASI